MTNTLLMIRPVCFDLNEQTTASNTFQQIERQHTSSKIQQLALQEFDNFVGQLQELGVQVHVFEDTLKPHTPDSIFPNNWLSFHNNNTIITYPMQAPNRRLERRADILAAFPNKKVVDLSQPYEAKGQFLEGTGSLILDRKNKMAYACRSPRTHEKVLKEWQKISAYQTQLFNAVDKNQQQIYHTNVMMTIGDGFVVICLESIESEDERQKTQRSLQDTGHEILDITYQQMNDFAGNMLQISNQQGQKIMVLSKTAYQSLQARQIARLQHHNDQLLIAAIPTIERYGGGSVRCMLTEVF